LDFVKPEDGEFTLLTIECLDSCGTAPMMQVDETYHENLTEERMDWVLAELELGTGDWWKNRPNNELSTRTVAMCCVRS
jgi:hypothetical protein